MHVIKDIVPGTLTDLYLRKDEGQRPTEPGPAAHSGVSQGLLGSVPRILLILRELQPWRKTVKRKPRASSKYYFFDVGIVSALQGRPFLLGTPEFGEAFETFLM
jgi:hypothetical protein